MLTLASPSKPYHLAISMRQLHDYTLKLPLLHKCKGRAAEMCMQALLALASRSKGLLLLHVVLSMMAGAALGAHNAAIFLDWEVRCSSLVAVQVRPPLALHSGLLSRNMH